MRRPQFTGLIAALLGVGSLLAIFLSFVEFPPRVPRQIHRAIGQALAKEALNLLGPGGTITVLTRDTESFRQPAMDILLRSFKKEIGRASQVPLATQSFQLDPLRPVEIPSGDFYELIRRARTGHVIVSLLGPPLLTEEQRNRLGRIQPKIVAFCPGNLRENLDLRRLFEAGLLHAAVICRRPSPDSRGTKRYPSRTFDQLYETVTTTGLTPSRSHSGSAL